MLAFSSIERTNQRTSERTYERLSILQRSCAPKGTRTKKSGWSVGGGVYGGFGDKRGESILMYGSKAFSGATSSTILYSLLLLIPTYVKNQKK